MTEGPELDQRQTVGPYSLLLPIASGGFGQVFLGRQAGVLGRLVALKGLSAEKQDELEAVAMLIDEARIASRVQHPNVVPILDVVEQGSRIWLVMEHVHGETLARLLARAEERGEPVPARVARAIACGMLRGLHAAHVATDTTGQPLDIVHRDVSPHNVIISAYGVARVLDFGIAKAAGRLSITRHGQLKGKLAYMAPEQFSVDPVDRRVDIYAASVVIAELFAGRRLREPKDVSDALARAATPDSDAASLEGAIGGVIARGRSKSPNDRYPTAGAMADAIEASGQLASEREVAGWLNGLLGSELDERRARWEREGGVALVAEQAPQASDATVSAVAIAKGFPPRAEEGATELCPPPAKPRKQTPLLPLVAAAAAAIGLALAVWLVFREPAPRATARAGLPDVASVLPSARDTVSSASPAPPTAEQISSIALPIALPSAEPSAESTASGPPVSKQPLSAKPKTPRPDCDPPYKLDHRGVKVLKLECLR